MKGMAITALALLTAGTAPAGAVSLSSRCVIENGSVQISLSRIGEDTVGIRFRNTAQHAVLCGLIYNDVKGRLMSFQKISVDTGGSATGYVRGEGSQDGHSQVACFLAGQPADASIADGCAEEWKSKTGN